MILTDEVELQEQLFHALNVKSACIMRVRGTGSAVPQEMLIFWELLIFRIINIGLKFLVTRKRLTYHATITDGIACRPLNYGVWNACET